LQQWINFCTNFSPKKWGVGNASPPVEKSGGRRSPPQYTPGRGGTQTRCTWVCRDAFEEQIEERVSSTFASRQEGSQLEHTHTHAHTHTIWILFKQETVSGSGISRAICKSAPRSRQITTSAPHHSVFTGRMPFLPPNQQRQSTEGSQLEQW